ncbi:restriction endonuclease subunit S [Pseudidiomarina taiwanensis]|uniref:Type I restriction modification DNA specificity domain-containing protein n=1 Tax=Pseudidiomarina taiwanensis TaxID=337250 RepID=A0A432ZEX3_9GAMM|nr:restriction endonuclease subunit S [Pseudidiomarina taiwanensis]RUO76449.1 hypothetical protein CWI83_08800 [Pseudidiomarina taiwanensis]
MRLVPVDTYLNFGNGKKRPADEGGGTFNVFGSNGVIGHCDEFNNPAGTIIIGRVGSYCGSVHYSPEQCWVTDNAIKGTAKTGADARYCYYLLLTRDLHSLRGGSGQPLINQTSLKSLEVPERSFADQKAIAHILGTLDDKIELNQKMNQTLEEIAKAIFKSWFVDFDPVRAKAKGRPIGLPPEISDLFPDELVDSEIGEIPKGWEVKTIEDVAKVTSGKRPPEKESVQSETCQYAVYGGAGPMAFCSEPLNFTKPAIITGRVGTLGKVFYLTDDCWVSDNSILICDAGVYSPLVFYVLQSVDLTALNVGSTQPLVTGKDIKNLNLVAPSDSLLQEYKGLFDLIKNRQSTANAEIEVLAELRDTLLPKLISGELRIPDAEKFLEEAGI